MKRILSALLVAAALILAPASAVTKSLPIKAVELFRASYEDKTWGCTAWRFRYPSGMVVSLTNYHCVSTDDGEPLLDASYTIGGRPAALLAGNMDRDIAMLLVVDAPSALPALVLATKAPEFGDPVTRIGYPQGYLLVSVGVVSNPALRWPLSPFPVAVYDYAGGPGSSGSPVLDASGRVVGMNAFSYGPYGGGPTLADLRLFLFGQ
jgi:S1-C subfamily serine protease